MTTDRTDRKNEEIIRENRSNQKMLRASCVLAATILHAGVAGALLYFGVGGADLSTQPPAKPQMPLLVKVGSAPAMREITVEPAEPVREEAPALPETVEADRPVRPSPKNAEAPARRTERPPKASEPVAEKHVEETKPNLDVGADTKKPKTAAYTPKWSYPEKAKERKWEGTVTLEFKIAMDGSCTDSRLVESSGFAILDREALRGIQKWRYPTEMAGTTLTIPYTYCLKCTDDQTCTRHAK